MTEKRYKRHLNFVLDDYANGSDRLMTIREVIPRLNELYDENEQLKQRNTNQYNQLNELWKLIEAKDWETLTAMDNQMKEDEERLQQEWKCYK